MTKWRYWYVVTWVNPNAITDFKVGDVYGFNKPTTEFPAETKDRKDFCIGAKFKRLCKLPGDYHLINRDTCNKILDLKLKRIGLIRKTTYIEIN